ncbi:DoxX family membrane protein [Carboxylicivirga sp. A043]|uniref:DoxX family membrane protein n=1 Tax=Carboxylicivirga litoralis TaxID=2816963 RepID=UPI0021CB849F|nr:DoxX family membrane protein [Carboxylicivirga sp. A043]MCU4156432.1 DoxX family membrane protein [Carboxylicivirga sp. A043]
MKISHQLNASQLYALVLVRVLLGWYLLYEGLAKLLNPHWSSFGYLKSAQGIFSNTFHTLADNPQTLEIVNQLNIWGLMAIGCALILGIFGRFTSLAGVFLILLYYLAHPPLIHVNEVLMTNENTLWVDKNLIFIAILIVLYLFPTSRVIGIDRFICHKRP